RLRGNNAKSTGAIAAGAIIRHIRGRAVFVEGDARLGTSDDSHAGGSHGFIQGQSGTESIRIPAAAAGAASIEHTESLRERLAGIVIQNRVLVIRLVEHRPALQYSSQVITHPGVSGVH